MLPPTTPPVMVRSKKPFSAARNMMLSHQLEEAECQLEADAPVEQGRHAAKTTSSRITHWEASLTRVICDLIGGVKCYENHIDLESGVRNGKFIRFGSFMFYGVAGEAELASQMYEELVTTIVTMAKLKFKSWSRGEGGTYAEGFVQGLAIQIQNSDDKAESTGTSLVVQAKAMVENKRRKASLWLAETHGIHLRSKTSRKGAKGSDSAFTAGKNDGQSANLNGLGRHTKQLT